MKKILICAVCMLGLGCGSVFGQAPRGRIDQRAQSPAYNRNVPNRGVNPGKTVRTSKPTLGYKNSISNRGPLHVPAPVPVFRGQVHPYQPAPPAPRPIPPTPPAPPAPRPSLFSLIISLF